MSQSMGREGPDRQPRKMRGLRSIDRWNIPVDRPTPSAYRAGMDQPPPLPRRVAWFAPWAWQRRFQIASLTLLALIGYPLSVGPARWLFTRGYLPPASASALEAVYAPLTWACIHGWDLGILAEYAELWDKRRS